MEPVLAVAGVAALVAFLRSRGRAAGAADEPSVGADAPPVSVHEPPLNPATGEVLGSAEDIAHGQLAFASEHASWIATLHTGTLEILGAGVTTGVSVGTAIGGPPGAMVGLCIAWVAGLVTWFFGLFSSPPPRPPFPVRDIGVPYRPGWARVDNEAVTLKLPALVPDSSGRLYPQRTQDVSFPLARLRDIFPGRGAVEACIASGMMAWRPYDVPTPFARELHSIVPSLGAYEATFLPPTPDDFTAGEQAFRWVDREAGLALHAATGDERVRQQNTLATVLVFNARRLCALRELRLDSAHEIVLRSGAALGFAASKEPAGTVVMRSRRVGAWLANGPAATGGVGLDVPGATPEERATWFQLVSFLADACDVGLLRCDDRDSGKCTRLDLQNPDGMWDERERRWASPAGCGFPGAWRLRHPSTPTTPGAVADCRTETRVVKKVTWPGGLVGIVTPQVDEYEVEVEVCSPEHALLDVGAPQVTSIDDRGGLTTNWEELPALLALELDPSRGAERDSPDPENGFLFECFTYRGGCVVHSSWFVGPPLVSTFGPGYASALPATNAEALAWLEGGRLAWGAPQSNPAVRERWAAFDPNLPRVAKYVLGTWAGPFPAPSVANAPAFAGWAA